MAQTKFQQQITNPLLFKMYLLKKLPMAYLAGIRLPVLTDEKAITKIKYSWINQNPFKSMYFACLSMAAEMSSGVLVLNGVFESNPPVSMLIIKNQAVYHKKAVGTITFTCADGKLISEHVQKAIATGESITLGTTSIGKDESGDVVAEFIFTWSMKVKGK